MSWHCHRSHSVVCDVVGFREVGNVTDDAHNNYQDEQMSRLWAVSSQSAVRALPRYYARHTRVTRHTSYRNPRSAQLEMGRCHANISRPPQHIMLCRDPWQLTSITIFILILDTENRFNFPLGSETIGSVQENMFIKVMNWTSKKNQKQDVAEHL